jgi:hypothetical protein
VATLVASLCWTCALFPEVPTNTFAAPAASVS